MQILKTKSGRFNLSSGWDFARQIAAAAIATRQVKTIGSWKWPLLAALLLVPAMLFAQQYSIDWYTIAGGGGTSTNSQYSISGTIGQPDASGTMTGGNFSMTGGFWAIYAVQTPGVPDLLIVINAPDSVEILWSDPATNTYVLQQNGNLAGGNWITSGYSISSANGTNSITIGPSAGNLFFRLKR